MRATIAMPVRPRFDYHRTMPDTPNFAAIAALAGEPARASMLTALVDGRALTATELAIEAGVVPSTASSHLGKMLSAGLISIEKQGRHRYYRLSSGDVADLIERLMGVASAGHVRTGPADNELRTLRVCYDHFAGERAVALFDALRKSRRIVTRRGSLILTKEGEAFCRELGIDLEAAWTTRRPLCRACLDWSERRHHLAGALGAAILDRFLTKRWARRDPASRVVRLSPEGERRFREMF
jgi:DNA-binding transcriptional ArsR family regulator